MKPPTTNGQVKGAPGRSRGIEEIEAKAKKSGVLARGGGQAKPGAEGGGQSGVGGGAGGPAAGAPAAPSSKPVDAAAVAAVVRRSLVDAVKGVHSLGFAVTGHKHWTEIPSEKVERAAGGLEGVISKLPPAAHASVINTAIYAGAIVAGWDVLGAPVVESLRLRREEKKAKEAAGEPGENGAKQ